MNDIFRLVVSLSLSGSLLILVLLSGRPLFRNRVSKRWQYYIWLVVIARLLLPFAPEGNLMGTLADRTEQALRQIEQERQTADRETEAEETAGSAGDRENNLQAVGEETVQIPAEGKYAADEKNISTGTGAGRSGAGAMGIWQYLWLVWLCGAAFMLVRKITVYQSFVKYVRAGWREVSDIELLDVLAEAEEQMGIKRPVELYQNAFVSSPFLLGFLHPCIVLPSDQLEKDDFRYTVRHELTHYKRRDALYKWLVQISVCLHWFNPLVRLMEKETERACELACDEGVIKALDEKERRVYGDVLLRAAEGKGTCREPIASLTLSESGKLLKERLSAIGKFKKQSKTAVIVSAAVVMAFAAGAVMAGAAAPEKKTESSEEAFDLGGSRVYDNIVMLPEERVTETVNSVSGGSRDENMAGVPGTDSNGGEPEIAVPNDSKAAVETPVGGNRMSASSKAEEYYENDSISGFGREFYDLDEKEQEAWLGRAYRDEEIAFFAAGVQQLDTGSALFEVFAQKAYADEKIGFFSVLTDYMDEAALEEWRQRAVTDRKFAFQSVLLTALDRDWEKEAMAEELDRQREEGYQRVGVTREGKRYYYQGQLVGIFLDMQPDSAFHRLDMNPEGTVNIKIVRDAAGAIKGVEYMTEEEVKELFGEE